VRWPRYRQAAIAAAEIQSNEKALADTKSSSGLMDGIS